MQLMKQDTVSYKRLLLNTDKIFNNNLNETKCQK